jgi:hypothetical protein
MSAATTYLWRDARLEARDDCDVVPARMRAADSWLVSDGSVLALDLHRTRFRAAVEIADPLEDAALRDTGLDDTDAFWRAAIETVPRTGDWFPRVEFREQLGSPQLLFRLREAPERRRSAVLATHLGADPRTEPRIKGPDLEAMLRLRTEAQDRGADEAVILSEDGFVAEGSTSAFAWWRGDALAIPAPELDRVDSVTLRSVLALATALGVEILPEWRTPEEFDGLELWALNAKHGIRIVTSWVDGPALAAEPGRLDSWRARLDALRRPLPEPQPEPVTA